jgi:hypothetical protein
MYAEKTVSLKSFHAGKEIWLLRSDFGDRGAKMRSMGLIDHVSRFNKIYGHREGWVFSSKFQHSSQQLAERTEIFSDIYEPVFILSQLLSS